MEKIVTAQDGAPGDPERVPYGEPTDPAIQPESDSEAEQQGAEENQKFWKQQIEAALVYENRWRQEGETAEALYFGPDKDPGKGAGNLDPLANDSNHNEITDKVSLIHSTIDVLKPLIYSDTPSPVVRRRFRGDGKTSEADLMVAETAQRLAEYLLDTSDFDQVMEHARDDWLLAARGEGRVAYRAVIAEQERVDELTGQTVMVPTKISEEVLAHSVPWRSMVIAPGFSWQQAPWVAFSDHMTRRAVAKRFGDEIAKKMNFKRKGLVGADKYQDDEDMYRQADAPSDEPRMNPNSPFDTAVVWEIWNREEKEVIWYSPDCPMILDKDEDLLGLEKFWPCPKPLLATTKGETTVPRPDITYYERRAREIDEASKKLRTILEAVSVSGLFPGEMQDEVKKILRGTNEMVGVSNWIALMEKGGTANIIQWLPLDAMVAAIQALQVLREQAKDAMFEASGVSDIMRAQGDPRETATAQQIKGRYAGVRLQDRQRKMAIFARDFLALMLEVAVEHFDVSTIAEIVGLDLPMTEMEREALIAQDEARKREYQQLAQMHQMMEQAVQAGQMPGPMPPAPQPPPDIRIPGTSWEVVHGKLKSDFKRKITISIETDSTILVDEQADKEARVEFLSAFATFVAQVSPMVASGVMDYATVKEILLFGVRGFPKSRTLESLIADLPDEPQGEPQKDPAITIAEIKAQVDMEIAQMEMADKEREREHEVSLKRMDIGGKLVGQAADIASNPPEPPQPPEGARA